MKETKAFPHTHVREDGTVYEHVHVHDHDKEHIPIPMNMPILMQIQKPC